MSEGRIHVELTITRRYRLLSASTSWMFQALREGFRVMVVAVAAWVAFQSLETMPAAALSLGLLWVVSDGWFRRESPGKARVLLTDDGVHYVEDGFFCPWEEVATHHVAGPVLVFEPGPGIVPPGLFRPHRWRIPLGGRTREKTLEMFRTRAPRRRPEASDA